MSNSIYAYYKLPRISRTPSPPIEYLRRRQEMGGASLPPLPEDENFNTDQLHSRWSSSDYEASRPKKKRKPGSLRIKQKAKGGLVDWSRVFSDGEDGGEILDSIVVKGGVLSTSINAAWSPDTKRTKVVSQKIKSRKQRIVEAPIGKVLEQHSHDAHMPAMVVTPVHSGQSPRRLQASISKSSQTPTKKRTVKYVKPYSSLHLYSMGCSTAKTRQPLSQDFVPLTQGTLEQPVMSPANPQPQKEQPDSIDENASHHNRASPCDSSVNSASDNSRITSELADVVRRSARQPVISSEIREGQRSPSPTHLTLLVSRTDASPSFTVRPFKIAGDEFIKGGRWMWLQLISIIKDRTHFDPSQDEVLLNWITPLPDIDMLRDQQKEMKRMGNNEIVVVRTTKEGYWPEWMYERIKERKRQLRRECERERLEKEQAKREARRKMSCEEVIRLPSKVGEILPVVAFKHLLAPTSVNGTVGQDGDNFGTMTIREESTPSILEKPIENSMSKPVREEIFNPKPMGTREIVTSPPVENEAVAPEIPQAQKSSDTISSTEIASVFCTFLNQVPHLEQSEDLSLTHVQPPTVGTFPALPPPTVAIPPIPPTTLPLPRPLVLAIPTAQSSIIESVPKVQPGRVTTEVSAEVCTPITPAALIPPLALPLPPGLLVLPAPLVPASMPELLASAPLSSTIAPLPTPPASATPMPSPVQPGQTQVLASAAQTPIALPSGPSKVHVADGVPVTKYPLQPPPTFLGRPIPMPQAYKRPANMPPRPSLGFSLPSAHSKTGSATVHAPFSVNSSVAASSTASVSAPRVALSQDANVHIKNSSPLKPGIITAFPCNVNSNDASVELPPAAAAAASGPLAKWLSKQGGPTVKPRAVINNSVPLPVSLGKKRGRPVTRKSIPTTAGEPAAPVISQTRQTQGAAPPMRPASLSSSFRQFTFIPSISPSRAQTASALFSCLPSTTSSEFPTKFSHIDNQSCTVVPASAPLFTSHTPRTPSAPCTTTSSVLPAPPTPPVPSTSPTAPAPSSAPPVRSALLPPSAPPSTLTNQSTPLITQIEISTPVSAASLSTIESPFQRTDNTTMTVTNSIAPCTTATQTTTHLHPYNQSPDAELDLNLDFHLNPRTRKEARVPSWVKSKTPVSKSRLSGAGVLGCFGPGKSPSTRIQPTVSPVRPVSGIDKSTWGGKVPRGIESGGSIRDESILLSIDGSGYGDDLDMGLDSQRGVKRSSASVCPFSSKRRLNSLDLVPGQDTVAGSGLTTGRMNSEAGRGNVGDLYQGGGGDEEFLSWGNGGARTLGIDGESLPRARVEEDDGKDLDLGF